MKQSKTIFALLGWLSAESLSGYDLKKRTEQYVGQFWYGSFGQIYPLLHEMLEEGLVTVHEEQHGTRPPRKVYTITESGRQLLGEWMKAEPEEDLFRSELLLRLFFGHLASKETLRSHLEKTLRIARGKLAHFEEIRKTVETAYKNSPHLPYMLITLDRGEIVNKGFVEWAERSLNRLRADANINERNRKSS
ncbi:PadR family transcriptional regulator [bacterium]|nr:PadR family transcriptional regulator [bacterium]